MMDSLRFPRYLNGTLTNLNKLTIKEFHDGLRAKRFSAREATEACFRAIKENDKKLGAFLSINEEPALETASGVDTSLARGEELPELAGVPLAIKDNIAIQGFPTTAGSRILEFYKAPYDASVITKLKEQRAVFLGKTNLDEFAMGSSTENSAYQFTRNPYDPKRVPGGSSGGSAVAVAANLAIAALGSETNGSVRQPAGFCGIVGLNPTYGSVSRSGLIAMASSMDKIGPLTKTVEDAALLFRDIAGHDPMDATSIPAHYNWDELLDFPHEKIKSMVIGLPKEYFAMNLDETIDRAIDSVIKRFESAGITIKTVSLPHTKYALACYYIIMPAEVSANLARFDGIRYARIKSANVDHGNIKLKELYLKQRGLGFGSEAKRRIILGTFVLSSGYYDAYYKKAQQVRARVRKDFEEAFKEVDVILAPTSPTVPFAIGERTADPLAMYLADIFMSPSSLAGFPGISIPVKSSTPYSPENLPIGFQLIGKHFREADILGLGQYYEKS